jgi:succinate dehydrogenase/fumarate reductase-like Fe-S protein
MQCLNHFQIDTEGGVTMIETIEIINEKHNGKWVFMVDCEEDEFGSVISGRVALSDEKRLNLFSRLAEYEDNVSLTSFRFAGNIHEGVSIL